MTFVYVIRRVRKKSTSKLNEKKKNGWTIAPPDIHVCKWVFRLGPFDLTLGARRGIIGALVGSGGAGPKGIGQHQNHPPPPVPFFL